MTPPPPWQYHQRVNRPHSPNCKYSSSSWPCFRSPLQPGSYFRSSINLYEKLALLKGMNERLVITLVLSCVNRQFFNTHSIQQILFTGICIFLGGELYGCAVGLFVRSIWAQASYASWSTWLVVFDVVFRYIDYISPSCNLAILSRTV